MNKEIESCGQIIDDSENIVFSGGLGVSTGEQYSGFYEVRTACISRNTSIHRNRSSIIPSLCTNTEGFYEFHKRKDDVFRCEAECRA